MKKPSFVTFWTLASALGLAAVIPAQGAVRVAPKADAKKEAQEKAKKEKSADADLQRRLKELVGLLENDELSDKERAMARKTLAEAIKELGRKDNTFVWSTQAPEAEGMEIKQLGEGVYTVTEVQEGEAPKVRRVMGLGGVGGVSVAERVAKARQEKEQLEREVAEVAEAPKARRIGGSGTGAWVLDTTKDNVRWLELTERQKKAAVELQKAAKEQALVLERVKAGDLRARAVELQKAATERAIALDRTKADEVRHKVEVQVERAKQDHAAEVRREVERARVRSSQSPRGRRVAVREADQDDDAEIRAMIQQMRNEMREIRNLLRQMQNDSRPRATGMGGMVPLQAPAAPAAPAPTRMMVRTAPPADASEPAAAPSPRIRSLFRRAPTASSQAPAAETILAEPSAPAAAEAPAEPAEPAPPAEPRLRRLMR